MAVTKIVQYRNSVCFSECVPWTFCWNHHEFGCCMPILHPDLLSKNWVTGLSSLLQIWDMELGSNQSMESLFHLIPKVRSGLLAGCSLVMQQPNLNPTKEAALWFKQGRWCSLCNDISGFYVCSSRLMICTKIGSEETFAPLYLQIFGVTLQQSKMQNDEMSILPCSNTSTMKPVVVALQGCFAKNPKRGQQSPVAAACIYGQHPPRFEWRG